MNNVGAVISRTPAASYTAAAAQKARNITAREEERKWTDYRRDMPGPSHPRRSARG